MTGAEPTETESEQPSGGSPTWSKVLIAGAAALAILLVGATIGMLVTRSAADEPAATPGPGSVEVGFAQDMSLHHLQAVTMANWERDHTTSSELKQLAFDIGSTQTEQVGRMKGWLMLWDQPEQAPGAVMTWMTDMGGHGGMSMPMPGARGDGAVMPGMATNTELATMRTRTGKALDVDFLQLMLRHHQGGTAMAQYALDHSGQPAVRALARSMLTSQGAEITQMTQMLTARGASPLPAP